MKRVMSVGSRNVLTLLPPLSFVISFFLFILTTPPLVPVPGDQATMKGNGGYTYQPTHNNQNVSYNTQTGLIAASGYYHYFHFQRNEFESIPVYQKSVSITSGIRAPPFKAHSAL